MRRLLGLPCLISVLALTACSQAPQKPAIGVTTGGPFLKHVEGEVRALADAPARVAPSGAAEVMLLAEGHNAFLGKLVLAPNQVVPEHQDPTEEYIHVLSGTARMTMDGTAYEVREGTTVYMPAFAKVSVQNGPEPLVAIQVFAGPGPARRYDAWQLKQRTNE